MLKKVSWILFSLFMLSGVNSKAQDPHYSQYFNSPIFENPANTGFFNGTYRAALNYKNQWRSISNPYTTSAVSLDAPLLKRLFHHDAIGIGGLIVRDKAGDSEYGFTSGGLSLSYHKALNRRGNSFLLVGIQYSIVQKTIDYSALRFGDQFNGNSYDPDIQTNEKFVLEQLSYSDFNLGTKWFFHSISGITYHAGFSISHINQPNQSLYNIVDIPLKRKFLITYGNIIPIKGRIELQPGLSYSRQGRYNELLFGTLLNFNQTDNSAWPLDFNAGLYNRWKDAVIFMVGATYKLYNFGLSYDLNYSGLRKSSVYRGGPEISVIVTFGKERNIVKREVSCPIF